MWLPGHLADVESDMSAIHRADDIGEMQAARFFKFAWRLPCYRGAMRERTLAEQRERDDAPATPARSSGGQATPARAARAQRAAPVTEAALDDPVMSKVFSFG